MSQPTSAQFCRIQEKRDQSSVDQHLCMLCFYEIMESAGKGHKERMYCKRAPEYWLLSGRLLGAHGYLGANDFVAARGPHGILHNEMAE